MSTPAAEPPAGYRELLRGNPDFRRIWIAQIVSLLGDWFNTIALYTLVTRLTGSPLALGAVFVLKLLPLGLASPVAGLIVDRWNRRRVMIGSDLVRAVVVLGFLLVDRPGHVPLLYVLITLQVVAGAVFEPARTASLPNITRPRELLTANALSAATWSAMLALGAAAGGVATEWLGARAVFALDAVTYLVSAWFVHRTTIPQATEPQAPGPLLPAALAAIADGWRYLRRHPPAGRIALAKASWSVGGGGLVYMLALAGGRISPLAPAAAIGVLYAVRGLGTGLGPLLARRLFLDARRWPAVMGSAIALSGLAYATVAALGARWWIVAPVLVAHAASGANWVLATVELQRRAEDRYRGRVFATEWLLLTTAESLSILLASTLLESGALGLRQGFAAFAAAQLLTGAVWWLTVVPAERRA